MKKEYWLILITYIIMQFSSFIGVPLVSGIGLFLGYDEETVFAYSFIIWTLFSFSAALLITLFLLRKEMFSRDLRKQKAPLGTSAAWAVGGIFLAYFAQVAAASIESILGIEMKSENTEAILNIIEAFPVFIIITSVIGPILEEIVFRKVIFGSLYQRFNFAASALISSLIFAVAHRELEHLLLYTAMGFTFAFLYVKTKRILVPIFAHVAMNTIVVLLQSVFKEDIERIIREAEQIQGFIGGLLS